MRCLIIDNYDSFTWNLGDYVAQIFGKEPLILRNDECTWPDIKEQGPFGSIIVSPGPGSVTNPADFNVSREVLLQDEIPVLGVCLGFQGLAHIYGGEICHAPMPFHGRISAITHEGCYLFEGIPSPFDAVRYHSLVVVRESLPPQLLATAASGCGLLMGLRHATRPKWGVQFHPESILTVHGKRIIKNFRDLAHRYHRLELPPTSVSVSVPASTQLDAGQTDGVGERIRGAARTLRVFSAPLPNWVSAECAFLKLYAREKNAFWLDSQKVSEDMSRFSFMGSVPDDAVVTCSLGQVGESARQEHLAQLEQELRSSTVEGGGDLPFEFRGGYVGFMTYEMKASFGARQVYENTIPDSLWMRVDRFIAFDHIEQRVTLVAIADEDDEPSIRCWMAHVISELQGVSGVENRSRSLGIERLSLRMSHSAEEYIEAIRRCKEKIIEGESYEVCLTNQFSFEAQIDVLDLYLTMRRENPAPFGGLIRSGKVSVISNSPERLLKVNAAGRVESKPIKGTCARHDDPEIDLANALRLARSEKDRAENLMIVDLIRNDLARVSAPGSVRVPKLMEIESYTTVHQMVSTVESVLKPDRSLLDLLRAVFPGGSITGAPKIRTMEIIDGLERGPRGVYCGSIGYLGYNRVAELNIAIRTLSYDGRTVRFGAGGAITYLSDPNAELDEVLLKAEAVLRPIWHYINWHYTPLVYHLLGRELRVQEPAVTKQAS